MTFIQKIFDGYDMMDAFGLTNVNYHKPKEEYKYKVPGFGKEDLTAKVTTDGYLYIKGDNGEETFEKYLSIPGITTESNLKLTCDKGILRIKIPKNKTPIHQFDKYAA